MLEDTSPMPFGKFKGTPMQDVPASYLHWFFTTCLARNTQGLEVKDYIRKSLSALKLENPDLIWKEYV